MLVHHVPSVRDVPAVHDVRDVPAVMREQRKSGVLGIISTTARDSYLPLAVCLLRFKMVEETGLCRDYWFVFLRCQTQTRPRANQ